MVGGSGGLAQADAREPTWLGIGRTPSRVTVGPASFSSWSGKEYQGRAK